MKPTPPHRLVLVALLGIPLLCFLLAAAAYRYAIGTTPLGRMGLDQKSSPYPDNRPAEVAEILHGREVRDAFRWLEDEKSPDVQAWMAAQNKLTRAYLDSLPARAPLVKRFRELYYIDAIGAPAVRGERFFYKKRDSRQEKSVLYWREGADGEERVLIDPAKLSPDLSISLGVWVPSRDGRWLAYTLHPNNADEATLFILEVATGKVREGEEITGAKYAYPSWLPDGSGFYYTWLPEVPAEKVAERPGMAEVRFHRLGTRPADDPVVHPATGDPSTFLGAGVSWDGRWLIASISHGWVRNDLKVMDLSASAPAWKDLVTGQDALVDVEVWEGDFYFTTNAGAPRYRVLRAPAGLDAWAQAREIVPQRPDVVIENASVVGGRLLLMARRHACSLLEVRQLDGSGAREIELPSLGEVYEVKGEPDADRFYYGFSSLVIPPQIRGASISTGEERVWARIEVPVDPSPYEVKQVRYPSRDGTEVTMFLVYNKEIFLNGQTPFLLTGYGGFNVSMGPDFIASIYPWLEAGGGFAMPNLRGGGEYGEEWHRAGMGTRKQNTFDDFIAAAEYLLRQRYTSADRLAIKGGSNGGLLVGAAITQRPELFRAAVCAVPLLDMVRYTQFGSGKTWMGEYGDPEKPDEFAALLAYSPYHRVQDAGRYPAVLFLSADHDDRVDPMHARKMAAALQTVNASPFPILLRIEEQAGHGGADQVAKSVDVSADWMAFLMTEVHLRPKKEP